MSSRTFDIGVSQGNVNDMFTPILLTLGILQGDEEIQMITLHPAQKGMHRVTVTTKEDKEAETKAN